MPDINLGQFAAKGFSEPKKPAKMKVAVDISKWNGVVDYKKMASNDPQIDLVIIRASEGTGYQDPMFIKNVIGATSQGFKFSSYHFCTWNNSDEISDATQEAKAFVGVLKRVAKPGYKVWIDTETNKTNIILSPAQLVRYIQTFRHILTEEGYDHGLYGSRGFFNQFLPDDHPFGEVPLWLANYTNKPQPTLPKGWSKYTLWQWTDQGVVSGINSRVDLNRFAP